MDLFVKKGRKYHQANDAEIFQTALEIMRNHPRLKGVAAHIELEMLFGKVTFNPEDDRGVDTPDIPLR